MCKICLDVLAKAESSVASIASQVKQSGYEYADFKIAFSISIRVSLNRLLMVTRAEASLSKDFSKYFAKATFKFHLDFKEVFKWIVSPLLVRELSIPANLEGTFLVTCAFLKESTEGQVDGEAEEIKGEELSGSTTSLTE